MILGVSLVGTLVGCEQGRTTRPAEPTHAVADEASRHHYSPFIVHVDGGEALPFDVISFKDVGMSLPAKERAFIYETIAQSLSHELSLPAEDAPLMTRVAYSEAITDPANHRACSMRHIYVDLWHDASSEQYGYSLWSGCGENDRFDWQQVPAGDGDGPDRIAPVTRTIAASLRSALETGCFSRHC